MTEKDNVELQGEQDSRQRILVVDDEASIRRILETRLKMIGYDIVTAADGEEAIAVFNKSNPDLIVLDVMMPKIDGYGVVREVRRTSDVPIIILTALGDVSERITGLELGADDYVIKPFSPKELEARVKAVLRRSVSKAVSVTTQADPDIDAVSYPDLLINLTNYSVTYKGRTIEMPPKELELLYFLASSPNRVYTREQLLDRIWGYEYSGDTRTVDVHIKRIREKIGDHDNWRISTIWGKGYKFETS